MKLVKLFVPPAFAGKTLTDSFVPCCCENRLTFGSLSHAFDGFQPKVGHICNMGTLICWWGQRSQVKGNLRLSCKVGRKCKSVFIWKDEVQLEPNLIYWYNMKPFVLHEVKGHQRSSCTMGSKCKIHLIWKVEIWLEPNLNYWYNVGTFTCS